MIHKNKNYKIYIDPEDAHLLIEKAWHIKSGKGKFYLVHNYLENGRYKSIWLHREILGAISTQEVDHVNGNGLDNRKENLRVCNRKENTYNRKPNKGSKYKGVTLKPNGKWEAQIQKDGKKISIGRFTLLKDALLAYNQYATKLFGQFAYLNTIK